MRRSPCPFPHRSKVLTVPRNTVATLAVMSILAPPGWSAIPLAYRAVALTGDPVPGMEGLTFEWLVGTPVFGGAGPRIGSDGAVSFGGGWNLTFPFPHGIFRDTRAHQNGR